MFVHQHVLRYLLRPEHYCTQRQHDLELEQLFLPAWHFIAAKSELPKDGVFLTLELFGRPLLLRNSGGRFLAFENICSHRHCLLTDAAAGHQPKLRCQYHDWEFDDDGRTAKIPEAKCFRPWDRDNSQLTTFRVDMTHLLHHRYTGLNFDANSRMEKLQASLKQWLGGKPEFQYLHRHIHPNTVRGLHGHDQLCFDVCTHVANDRTHSDAIFRHPGDSSRTAGESDCLAGLAICKSQDAAGSQRRSGCLRFSAEGSGTQPSSGRHWFS